MIVYSELSWCEKRRSKSLRAVPLLIGSVSVLGMKDRGVKHPAVFIYRRRVT